MVDLAEEGAQSAGDDAAPTKTPLPQEAPHEPRPNDSPSDIHVTIEGATTDSTRDYGLRSQEYDEFLKEFYGGNVPQTRRRSFSPKPIVINNNSINDVDKESTSSDPNMLIHGNKRYV